METLHTQMKSAVQRSSGTEEGAGGEKEERSSRSADQDNEEALRFKEYRTRIRSL